ncbi:MAG TPA: N-acetylglucosamine-6-phosphate deacetylase [Actinobacteria bacterium]|nr:N-acetylglucosamine-6-phosphate deacetylase [Actinomycetota bacterium]
MGRRVSSDDDRSLFLVGGEVLTPEGRRRADVTVYRGELAAIGEATPSGGVVVDAVGLLVAPGFVDLQINGGFGRDFTSEPGAIWEVGARLPETGVTAFLPTIITAPRGRIDEARRVLDAGPPPDYRGAVPLGLHLEGPFLSSRRAGTHDPDLLRPPTPEEVADWSVDRHVRLVTLAPELPGATAIVRALVDRGVLVALGHSDASYEEALAGIDAGARLATHLFNAMSPLSHRAPGVVGAVLGDPRIAAGLIVDGIHVHPGALRVAWAAKGPEAIVLVTDAMAAMGMAPGVYRLGDLDITVDEGGPRNPEGRLAGSTLTLDRAVRNLVEFVGVAPDEAVAAAARNPARLLGLPSRGVVAVGRRADLVLLDADLEVRAAIVGGDVVFADPALDVAGAEPRNP